MCGAGSSLADEGSSPALRLPPGVTSGDSLRLSQHWRPRERGGAPLSASGPEVLRERACTPSG